jgi:hypothetical protein
MFPNYPPKYKHLEHPLILKCWFWYSIGCSWHEGQIHEANSQTQRAVITPKGGDCTVEVEYKHIRNVSLSYGYSGKILESFGSPRTIAKEHADSLPMFAEAQS